MKLRVAIVTEIIAPYRLPVFNSLARNVSVNPHIIFLSKTDPSLRQWRIYSDEIQFSFDVLPNWRRRVGKYNFLLNWGLDHLLETILPDTVICGGYNYFASWQAARWCKNRRIPFVLWSESTAWDERREHEPVEFLKRRFLRKCRAFVVPGHSAFQYLASFGVPERMIVTAPNAVDNGLFAQRALLARSNAAQYRARYELPQRFFLYCGRLTKSKGVVDALNAYASLAPDLRSEISLVFAGSGDARDDLQRRARSIFPGRVQFAGFVHREDLPAFYALADMLIFPTHSDPWGLVVNEAMACGVPIIATSVAGCAADLVENGQNGFVVEAGAVDQISAAMDLLARNSQMRKRFSLHSQKRISRYSPAACAQGLAAAVELVAGKMAYA